MAGSYRGLHRAQLSYDYLHTNSTTHEFLFGALAELVDNAKDARASRIDIYTLDGAGLRGGAMLCFLDDGVGMTPQEMADVITFGKSYKGTDGTHIGMYGNGLKSGSMRIGNDLMVFTKKDATMSCLFLSRTFHEKENISEVIVPIPSFDVSTRRPWLSDPSEETAEKHKTELELISKYSPFHSRKELFDQFGRIPDSGGTLVVVYNMKLLDGGDAELDWRSDPHDILLSNPADPQDGGFDSDLNLPQERKSFRAYISILYREPDMKVYIQGKKVMTKRLISLLYKPVQYEFHSNRFRARSEAEVEKAELAAKRAEERSREADSTARHLQVTKGSTGTDATRNRSELRKAEQAVVQARQEAQVLRIKATRMQKSLKEPKSLRFYFGVNIGDRQKSGLFMYNCGRLIKMFERVEKVGGFDPDLVRGIVGIVDVPYLVLEPTHNKQDFADAKEFRLLKRAMSEHMYHYYSQHAELGKMGTEEFWTRFGYSDSSRVAWSNPPSPDAPFVKKRAMSLPVHIQCDVCLKWRVLPFSLSQIGRRHADNWTCRDSHDTARNRCSVPQQQLDIPTANFQRIEAKNSDQRKAELEKQMEKLRSERDRLEQKTVKSYGDLQRQRQEESWSRSSGEGRKLPDRASRSSIPSRLLDRNLDSAIDPAHKYTGMGSGSRRRYRKRGLADSSTPGLDLSDVSDLDSSDGEPTAARAVKRKKRLVRGLRVGAIVEHCSEGDWERGRVIEVDADKGRVRVKFDNYSNDKFDVWVAGHSDRLRLISSPDASAVCSSTTADDGGGGGGASSAALAAARATNEELAAHLRAVLRYFMPPNWSLTQQQVAQLTVADLVGLDFENFFDSYESNMKQLVKSLRDEAEEPILALRRNVARALQLDMADTGTSAVDVAVAKLAQQRGAPSTGSVAAAAGGGGGGGGGDQANPDSST